jgi:hypothetical protein
MTPDLQRRRPILLRDARRASKLKGVEPQSTLTPLAKAATGFASIPALGIPNFLHSTRVVPVPQKGSGTMLFRPTANFSRYFRTKCGGNERTKRYQSCTARSSSRSLFVSRANSQDGGFSRVRGKREYPGSLRSFVSGMAVLALLVTQWVTRNESQSQMSGPILKRLLIRAFNPKS